MKYGGQNRQTHNARPSTRLKRWSEMSAKEKIADAKTAREVRKNLAEKYSIRAAARARKAKRKTS